MPSDVTRRQRQVLLAIWQAGDVPGAAVLLRANPNTVRTHADNARRRLGARTTLEAIRLLVTTY